MPKLSGVVKCSRSSHVRSREARILNYFNGLINHFLIYTIEVKFDDVDIYTVPPDVVPDDTKIDARSIDFHNIRLEYIDVSEGLTDQVLSLMYISEHEDIHYEELVLAQAVCFVMILHVDMKKRLIRIKSPMPEPLPSMHLMLSYGK